MSNAELLPLTLSQPEGERVVPSKAKRIDMVRCVVKRNEGPAGWTVMLAGASPLLNCSIFLDSLSHEDAEKYEVGGYYPLYLGDRE
jgi:hypothetical protein